mmetsp:Transcript_12342/g.30300  ORF Transcript_12342/g.30300 Transcript_12342/m.30300 type:complete len:209 (+) Transcript_12342:212-838(+)
MSDWGVRSGWRLSRRRRTEVCRCWRMRGVCWRNRRPSNGMRRRRLVWSRPTRGWPPRWTRFARTWIAMCRGRCRRPLLCRVRRRWRLARKLPRRHGRQCLRSWTICWPRTGPDTLWVSQSRWPISSCTTKSGAPRPVLWTAFQHPSWTTFRTFKSCTRTSARIRRLSSTSPRPTASEATAARRFLARFPLLGSPLPCVLLAYFSYTAI